VLVEQIWWKLIVKTNVNLLNGDLSPNQTNRKEIKYQLGGVHVVWFLSIYMWLIEFWRCVSSIVSLIGWSVYIIDHNLSQFWSCIQFGVEGVIVVNCSIFQVDYVWSPLFIIVQIGVCIKFECCLIVFPIWLFMNAYKLSSKNELWEEL